MSVASLGGMIARISDVARGVREDAAVLDGSLDDPTEQPQRPANGFLPGA